MGPLGIVGVGLLVCAAAVFVGWVLPTRSEVSAMQNRALNRDQQGGDTQHTAPVSQDPLTDFYDFFPPAETSAQWLGKVYAVAEKERLDLPRGEYRLVSPPASPSRHMKLFSHCGAGILSCAPSLTAYSRKYRSWLWTMSDWRDSALPTAWSMRVCG